MTGPRPLTGPHARQLERLLNLEPWSLRSPGSEPAAVQGGAVARVPGSGGRAALLIANDPRGRDPEDAAAVAVGELLLTEREPVVAAVELAGTEPDVALSALRRLRVPALVADDGSRPQRWLRTRHGDAALEVQP